MYVVKRNHIRRDKVFFVVCSSESRCKTFSAAEDTALKEEWPAAADKRAIDVFRNVVLLCEEDMKAWMTPSLFIPQAQGSTLGGGEIAIIE